MGTFREAVEQLVSGYLGEQRLKSLSDDPDLKTVIDFGRRTSEVMELAVKEFEYLYEWFSREHRSFLSEIGELLGEDFWDILNGFRAVVRGLRFEVDNLGKLASGVMVTESVGRGRRRICRSFLLREQDSPEDSVDFMREFLKSAGPVLNLFKEYMSKFKPSLERLAKRIGEMRLGQKGEWMLQSIKGIAYRFEMFERSCSKTKEISDRFLELMKSLEVE